MRNRSCFSWIDINLLVLVEREAGGGKSWAVRSKAVALCLRYPGIKVGIIRRTYPELEANHIKPLKKLLKVGTQEAAAKYNEQKKEMRFANSSEILFGYCATDGDLDRYQGTEYDVLFLEEATQLTEYQIKTLTACVRGVNDFPKRIYYTMNPGGKGHGYIKRIFIDRDYIAGEKPEEYSFIQSLVYDNKALMEMNPDYVNQLEALPEALREAWLLGNWDTFIGQVFREWRNNPEGYDTRRWSHVINDFEIDDSWKIYRGFDFGYAKPFAVIWIAIDHYGRMYLFKEYYGCTREPDTGVQMQPREIAQRIREIETQDPMLRGRKVIGIADPAIWQNTTGESIADMMAHEQVYFQPGDHTRLAGLMQVHYRLAFDGEGFPMLYVFKSCRNMIRTLPILVYDEHKVEDVDTTQEDHCLTGDTIVHIGSSRCTIKDLVDTIGYVTSSDGRLHRYHDVRLTQKNADVFRVTTEDGRTVTATANHRFMLKDGTWKRLDELSAGDELMEVTDGDSDH